MPTWNTPNYHITIQRPMLAASFDPLAKNQLAIALKHLPLLASYKLDGVRCTNYQNVLLSRSMKRIPNRSTQKEFTGNQLLHGLDGELIAGDPTDPQCYRKTVSAVMRATGTPQDVRWYVFDRWSFHAVARKRIESLFPATKINNKIVVLQQRLCATWDDVLEYEQEAIRNGYEGLILRTMGGLYKEGRSTLREGLLFKLKRFKTSEALVVDMVEMLHNCNMAVLNELGLSARSSHKSGKKGAGTMGVLVCRDLKNGIEFEIGTGFTEDDRAWWWARRNNLKAKEYIISYSHFPVGGYEKPRHPVYRFLRAKEDM